MKAPTAKMILGSLQRAVQAAGGVTDGQLVARYVSRRDDEAFTDLVRRHGPMVLGVCRRVLRHAQDAEDAFQATFLVLARKAAALADREAVGGWLHGVACRAAWAARTKALRRHAKEQQVTDMPQPVAPTREDEQELVELLDRELARLPEKYRLPVVLCELEGRSRREAALQLGLPEGTLSSRLARARGLLAARLARYGAAVTAATLGSLLAKEAAAACVPGALVVSTVRAAGGAVTAGAAALAQGVLKAMLLTKLKGAAWALLLAATLGVGVVALTYPAAAAPPPAADPPRSAPALAGDRDDLEALRLEVAALRRSLQATRERVEALEGEVRAQKAGATDRPGVSGTPPLQGGIGSIPSNDFAPTREPVMPKVMPTPAPVAGIIAVPPAAAAPPTLPPDPTSEVEAAAQRLRQKPDDPQAMAELDVAVKRFREWARRRRPPSHDSLPAAK